MIHHKKKFAKALLQWIAIMGLIGLSLWVHKGFWNIFVVLSWITGMTSLFVMATATIVTLVMARKTKKDEDFDKVIDSELVDSIALPTYRNGGVDSVHAECEQKNLDYAFMIAILCYLIFLGHITMSILWTFRILGRATIQYALEKFDDCFVEKI